MTGCIRVQSYILVSCNLGRMTYGQKPSGYVLGIDQANRQIA